VARGGAWQGIGGGPAHCAELNKVECLAGPSVPSPATPCSRLDLTPRTLLYAKRRARARLRTLNMSPASGSVYVIENGSKLGFSRTFDDWLWCEFRVGRVACPDPASILDMC
jgi:hypothetical protein